MNEKCLLSVIISVLPGINPKEKLRLLQIFEKEEDIIYQTKEDIERLLNRKINCTWDMETFLQKASWIEKICSLRKIKWVSWNENEYPPLLREMYDPPILVYYVGVLPNPVNPLLGMVGTRKPSPESSNQAYAISCSVGQAGISVVSGLALGIDAMSHRGNLASGVPGYAVLGSGLDEIYPSSNRGLARRIIESGGAIFSEYPPGTRPFKSNFPARNRIISALSRSVLIVEASQNSGALITAAFALEQGRELWVASCGLTEHQYSSLQDKMGTIKLACDGADIIYSACDILERWGIEYTNYEDNVTVPAWEECGRELASNMASFLQIEN